MENVLTYLVDRQARRYESREAVSFHPEEGESRWLTDFLRRDHRGDNGHFSAPAGDISIAWRDWCSLAHAAGRWLYKEGLEPQQHIGIFSANRPQNLLLDFGAYLNRGVPVSIYSTSSREQVEYIVNDAEIRFLAVGDQWQYAIAREVMSACPCVKRLIALTPVKLDADDDTTVSFGDLICSDTASVEEALNERTTGATPADVATIIYTSGTTGEPKGAVLPHSCFNSIIAFHVKRLYFLSDQDTSVAFLPLCHIFEKAWTYFCLATGMRVHINLDPREIQETLRRVRPTCMCSVPRFWEKVYTGIQEKLGRTSAAKRLLMRRAVKIGERRNLHYARLDKPVPRWLETRYRFYDHQIFEPMRKVVGVERGVLFPTAGAPLSDNITRYLLSCGIPIVIGYGLSETTATVSCFPHYDYEIGTIGTPLEGVDVKIGEGGEILVKGPTVMRCYHNKPEATAEAIDAEGWLHTGDAGYFDERGSLVLTERLKDLFKTSNGKYIAPQLLEARLSEDPLIEQVAVIGDRRKYASALIVPNFERLEEWARREGVAAESREALVADPHVKRLLERSVENACQGLARHEQIKRFTLLPREFTIDHGELTNTLKIRRSAINDMYARAIEAMYE